MRCSAHFCEGHLDVAFVFSTPGAEELRAGRPVAGATGENLSMALPHLRAARPDLFPSLERYGYRITNAWPIPTAVALGHPTSEASDSEIQESRNARRVDDELAGCRLAILSGEKAKLLTHALTLSERSVVGVPHVGNQGLATYRLFAPSHTPLARRQERVRLWAEDVLEAISRTRLA